jgi:hypothetical protein
MAIDAPVGSMSLRTGAPVQCFVDRVHHEKSLDQKEPFPQYVVQRGKRSGRLCTRSCDCSGKTRDHSLLDCGSDAAETQEKESATLIRASASSRADCAVVCRGLDGNSVTRRLFDVTAVRALRLKGAAGRESHGLFRELLRRNMGAPPRDGRRPQRRRPGGYLVCAFKLSVSLKMRRVVDQPATARRYQSTLSRSSCGSLAGR